jgi:hypothetical protein
MELIQFKSINGHQFKNLEIVWAAVNPEEEKDGDDTQIYDVDRLDPAQADRFHIIADLPYEPHLPYFAQKYGKDVAEAAVNWWNALTKEQKDKVSPRRLDYALDIQLNRGNIRDVLSSDTNPVKLVQAISSSPVLSKLQEHLKKNNVSWRIIIFLPQLIRLNKIKSYQAFTSL